MPSAVVDASALVDLFIGSPAADAIFARLFRTESVLHAPHSIDVEVAHAVRKLWRRGLLVDQDVDRIADTYSQIAIVRHGAAPFLHRIWRLRYNHSPYDAAYVALAEWLDLPLVTRDRRLARSSGHGATIEYVA
ncbi:MAG TPA: type II toxin-antitoxin system VapC family toxin [Mycobacterium sp.]|nr:type II toxin-antitoxin system VapC family toxin [Mycobacterium sp.]